MTDSPFLTKSEIYKIKMDENFELEDWRIGWVAQIVDKSTPMGRKKIKTKEIHLLIDIENRSTHNLILTFDPDNATFSEKIKEYRVDAEVKFYGKISNRRIRDINFNMVKLTGRTRMEAAKEYAEIGQKIQDQEAEELQRQKDEKRIKLVREDQSRKREYQSKLRMKINAINEMQSNDQLLLGSHLKNLILKQEKEGKRREIFSEIIQNRLTEKLKLAIKEFMKEDMILDSILDKYYKEYQMSEIQYRQYIEFIKKEKAKYLL